MRSSRLREHLPDTQASRATAEILLKEMSVARSKARIRCSTESDYCLMAKILQFVPRQTAHSRRMRAQLKCTTCGKPTFGMALCQVHRKAQSKRMKTYRLVNLQPTAKRRRCQKCAASLAGGKAARVQFVADAAPQLYADCLTEISTPSPKKPCATERTPRKKAA